MNNIHLLLRLKVDTYIIYLASTCSWLQYLDAFNIYLA